MQGTQTDSSARQYQTPDDGPQQRLDQFLAGLQDMLNTLISATIQQEGAGSKKFITDQVLDFVEQLGGATILGSFIKSAAGKARGARDMKRVPKFKPQSPPSLAEDAQSLHRGFKITDNETADRLNEILKDPAKYNRNMDAINNYFTRDVTNQTEFNELHGQQLMQDQHVPNDQLLAQWSGENGPASRLQKVENPIERIKQVQGLLETPIQRPFQTNIYQSMLKNPELVDGKTFAEHQTQKYRKYLNGEELPADAYEKGLSADELNQLKQFRGGPDGEAFTRIQEWVNSFDKSSDQQALRDAFQSAYKRDPLKIPGKLEGVLGVNPFEEIIKDPQYKAAQQQLLKYPQKFTELSDQTLKDVVAGHPTWKGQPKLETKYKYLKPQKAQKILDAKQTLRDIQAQRDDQAAQLVLDALQADNPVVIGRVEPVEHQPAKQAAQQEAQQQVDDDALVDHKIIQREMLDQPLIQQIQKLAMEQPQAFPPIEQDIMKVKLDPPQQAAQNTPTIKTALVPKMPQFQNYTDVVNQPRPEAAKRPVVKISPTNKQYIDQQIKYQQAQKQRLLEIMKKQPAQPRK